MYKLTVSHPDTLKCLKDSVETSIALSRGDLYFIAGKCEEAKTKGDHARLAYALLDVEHTHWAGLKCPKIGGINLIKKMVGLHRKLNQTCPLEVEIEDSLVPKIMMEAEVLARIYMGQLDAVARKYSVFFAIFDDYQMLKEDLLLCEPYIDGLSSGSDYSISSPDCPEEARILYDIYHTIRDSNYAPVAKVPSIVLKKISD